MILTGEDEVLGELSQYDFGQQIPGGEACNRTHSPGWEAYVNTNRNTVTILNK